jgi:integrase
VERGAWTEPRAVEPPREAEPVPTFHQLAELWWVRNEPELRSSTRVDYRTRLERHLLPFFADTRIDQITFDLVERYIAGKLAERVVSAKHPDGKPLSPRTINMTLTLMAAILDGAVERDLIDRNPAKGKSRRVREHEPRRSYLDTTEQIAALLDAAGELDGMAREDRRHVARRAIVATLIFAGLRIGELCGLRWRDVDLAAGWLNVTDAKTDAGRRRVKIRGALRDELLSLRARQPVAPDQFVFATAAGGRPSRDNLRNRVLTPAVELASRRLVEQDRTPLPERITPHSLRRTFASVLYAIGEDPGVVMDEMGHTDPALALRVYRQSMRRGDDEKRRLRALVDGVEPTGISADSGRRGTDMADELRRAEPRA